MFIDGIGISSFRSFGDDIQFIGPCSKVNIIIGQNNSGKSNILRFLKEYHDQFKKLTHPRQGGQLKLKEMDRHFGTNFGTVKVAFGLIHGGKVYDEIFRMRKLIANEHANVRRLANILLNFSELSPRNDGISWFIYESNHGNEFKISNELVEEIASNRLAESRSSDEKLYHRDWDNLYSVVTNSTYRINGKNSLINVLPNLLHALSPVNVSIPKVEFIDAIREIKIDDTHEGHTFSGINIIRELAKLERPDAGPEYEKARKRFEAINEFVADVTGKDEIKLEVPASEKTIQVQLDGKVLPLENLGTGIHEVIILAVAATLLTEQIVCIEEPEIHLHPILQKKLIRYLNDHTTNQYFITTHSAAMIDSPGAAVFHIQLSDGQSIVRRAITTNERFAITTDLGYRASDLLQANCIFWVEGPTDRLYLRHWLRLYDADLEEGLHYSTMFYGGRLLSNLTAADDEEVTDFINLRRINQNLAILIDSDRPKKGARLNDTKIRVRDEFDRGPGFAWVTEGREIENYISPEQMLAALKKIGTKVKKLKSEDRYEKRYEYLDEVGKFCEGDKLKIAKEIISNQSDPDVLNVLNLREMIKKAARFVRECNDMPLIV